MNSKSSSGGWCRMAGLLAVFCGCLAAQAAPIRVVATTMMVADLVREIGGGDVELRGLMGPGVDPHLYRPTRADVSALQRADVIFYNGLHLEGRMTEVLELMASRGRAVHAVATGVPRSRLLAPAEFEGAPDPHIWFDPNLWCAAVPVVVNGLSAADPENAAAYARRGAAYQERLRRLDEWARARIALLPAARRVLITSHDAYNYFGRAYDFQVIGVQGISTVSEAGLADVARIVALIRQRGIPAVFVESSVSPRLVQRISEDSGASLGGELFSDSMGAPGQLESAAGETYDVGTYIGMVKHNINQIVEALK